jgi:hypothetical protein
MAATIWRRLAATGEDMSSGEGNLYLPGGSELRVRYTRIGALPDGTYELLFEPVEAAHAGGPPTSDRPSMILREWRAADRESVAPASDGPGTMAAPDEANDAADKLRQLYHDSVVARTAEKSEA